MTAQPSAQFDISPVLKMYMESIDLWKRNYEAFMHNAKDMQAASAGRASAESIASARDSALLNWQKSSEDLFKRFVQSQIEICHFFSHRWEQYLKLPEQFSQCRSVTELGNLQAAFLSRFANDYMQETEKLAQPVAEAMTNWAGPKHA